MVRRWFCWALVSYSIVVRRLASPPLPLSEILVGAGSLLVCLVPWILLASWVVSTGFDTPQSDDERIERHPLWYAPWIAASAGGSIAAAHAMVTAHIPRCD